MSLINDLRKLIRPATVYTGVAGVMLLFLVVGYSQALAADQWRVAVQSYESIAHPNSHAQLCHFLDVPVGRTCDRKVRDELGFAVRFKREVVNETYPLAHAVQHPVGAGGVAAGMMGSFIGMILVAALAAAHVGGEWSSGTASAILARRQRRWPFFLTKWIGLWLGAGGLLLVFWLILAGIGPLLSRLYSVPPSPPTLSMGAFALTQFSRCVLLLGVVSAIGTAVGLIVRNPLGTFATTLGVLFMGIFASASSATLNWSFGYWVASWMHFRAPGQFSEHVWFDQLPLLHPDPDLRFSLGIALVGFAVVTAVMSGAGIFALRRLDIRR